MRTRYKPIPIARRYRKTGHKGQKLGKRCVGGRENECFATWCVTAGQSGLPNAGFRIDAYTYRRAGCLVQAKQDALEEEILVSSTVAGESESGSER